MFILDSLPDDVLFAILIYLDIKTLLLLARVSRNLNRVASDDAVWRKIASRCVNVQALHRHNVRWKSLCQVSYNWVNGRCRDISVMKFRSKLMPCIQLTGPQHLYVSRGTDIIHLRKSRGSRWQQQLVLKGHGGDVCHFVIHSRQLVSCGVDSTLHMWDIDSGCRKGVFHGHTDRVNGVDYHGDVIVSGSRDKSVKVNHDQDLVDLVTTEKVLCAYYSTSGFNMVCWAESYLQVFISRSFPYRALVSGSSGHSTEVPALQLWDIDRGQMLARLTTDDHRPGAGVLAVKWETPFTLLSCGYDSAVRLWDTRLTSGTCQEWEDPHDCTVYCVDSDDKWMISSGTNRYGVVRIWDKRWNKCIQSFYVGHNCLSPVYSLQCNRTNLFVALSNGLRMLDFSV